MAVKTWSGVTVAIQSALAVADTITGITAANPGVVTATAHGITDATYVLLESIGGTIQLNDKVVRTANAAANTFELEGVDTTSYTAYTSGGTASAITFGTALSVVRGLNASGGEPNFVDITTIHDTVQKRSLVNLTPISFALECLWDQSDAGLVALAAATVLRAKRAFKFTFSDGSLFTAYGYVSAANAPGGSAQDVVTTPVTFELTGNTTSYTS